MEKDSESAVVEKMLSQPGGKSKLYAVLKALTAMKLMKEDSIPSLILCTQGTELVLQ